MANQLLQPASVTDLIRSRDIGHPSHSVAGRVRARIPGLRQTKFYSSRTITHTIGKFNELLYYAAAGANSIYSNSSFASKMSSIYLMESFCVYHSCLTTFVICSKTNFRPMSGPQIWTNHFFIMRRLKRRSYINTGRYWNAFTMIHVPN